MTNVYTIGKCELSGCENEATAFVMDSLCFDFVNVCNECLSEIMAEVADEGRGYFYDWAEQSFFDKDKAQKLTDMVFGSVLKGEEPMVTMFTYGILKYPYNIKREGGINIVENCTVRGHKIYLYNSSFPVTKMTNNYDDITYGTLFDVPLSQVTEHYDMIEGYNPKAPFYSNMYNRIEVDVATPSGEVYKAQMYLANDRMFAGEFKKVNEIPTGNYDDKHLARSYGSYKNRRRK